MMKRQLFFTGMIFFFWFLFSCVKEEVSQIESGHFTWTPDLAIPFGSPEIPMDEYVRLLPDFDSIADITGYDSALLIYFNQHYYNNPITLTYSKTIDYNFSSQTDNLEYFTSASFRINAINRIPASISLQVYFKAQSVVLDSLFRNPLVIESAKVNEEGVVVSAFETWKNDAEFDSDKIELLSQVTNIEIYTKLTLPITKTIFIHYFSSQDVWIQLGGRFKLKVPL